MPDTSAIIELLAQWEEQYRRGDEPSVQTLCHKHPELVDELTSRIERRRRFLDRIDGTIPLPAISSAPPPLPTIPGYVLHEILGSGGTGMVYKAKQIDLNRIVAVKMIGNGSGSSHDQWGRFRSEAETVAQMQHPNIVQIHEVGSVDGRPFLALEYVDDGTLAQALKGQPLAARKAADLIHKLACAIQHAHDRGIVHRDIKPSNILMTRDGTPKMSDFGLAKRIDVEQHHTQTGTIVGTPCYMAPEQADGRGSDIGPAADVYALGVVLYQLLTGRVPFIGESILDTLEQVRSQEPIPPSQLVPKLPRDIEVICLKCLEKNITDRYASASMLATDLERFLQGESILAQPPTMLQLLAKEILRSSHEFQHFREWSNYFLMTAPVPPLLLLLLTLSLREHHYFSYIALATTFIIFGISQVILLNLTRKGFQSFPARLKRHAQNVLNANLAAEIISVIAIWWNSDPNDPSQLLLAYPMWTLLIGIVFYSFAAEIGFFYIIGSVAFLLSIPAFLFPTWAPCIVSLAFLCNIGGQGLFYRWLANKLDTPNRTNPPNVQNA